MATSLNLRELTERLLLHLRERIRRGEITERGLARLTGYSQPHIHNVLKGSRGLQIELADQMMAMLDIPLPSLFTQDELGGHAPPKPNEGLPVAILEGRLGGGAPFPHMASPQRRFFPVSQLAGLISPVLARIHSNEPAMRPTICPEDLVLMDRSPIERRRPRLESVYALCWKKKGYIGRCRVVGRALVVTVDNARESPEPPRPTAISDQSILDVVQGKIIWLGRNTEEIVD
jgi:hypothetical protein